MDAVLDRADPPRSEQAYEAIRDMIVSGRLRAGETISEVQLAEALAVSRTPVREAMKRLLGQRLVEVTPRGLRVFRPSAGDVAEVYFLRAAIEGAVARAAAARISAGQLAGLGRIQTESVGAAERGDVAALVELNGRFHRLLAEAAGSARAAAALRDLDPLVAAYRRLSLLSPEHQRGSVADHARLIGLLERRDGPGAEALVRDHIARAGRRVAEAVLQMEPAATGGADAAEQLRNLDGLAAPEPPGRGNQKQPRKD
jgi:GntR family transcriptional regulator, rspAB operon transcriptional repressor